MRNYDDSKIRMYESYSVFLIAAGYLAVAAGGGALMLSPTLRMRFGGWCRQRWARLRLAFGFVTSGTAEAGLGAAHAVGNRWQRLAQSARDNRWLVFAALCILVTPLVLVFVLRSQIETGSYENLDEQKNAVVAQLLQGEQLVPPPPLPPEAFLTQEVEQVRPMLVSASRDWQLLDDEFPPALAAGLPPDGRALWL